MRVVAPFVASVVGAFVQPAISEPHLHDVDPAADGPVPAAVAIAGSPAPVYRKACSADSGISGLATHSPCSGLWDVDTPEGLLHEPLHLHSEDGVCCFRVCKALLSPWLL